MLMPHLNVGAQKCIVLGPAGWCQNCLALEPIVAMLTSHLRLSLKQEQCVCVLFSYLAGLQ